MVVKNVKGNVASGNTLRGVRRAALQRYFRHSCLVGHSDLPASKLDEICSHVDDVAVSDVISATDVILSLNKRKRWLLPEKFEHLIHSGQFDFEDSNVSILERLKPKKDASCVKYVTNHSQNRRKPHEKRRLFSYQSHRFLGDKCFSKVKGSRRKEKILNLSRAQKLETFFRNKTDLERLFFESIPRNWYSRRYQASRMSKRSEKRHKWLKLMREIRDKAAGTKVHVMFRRWGQQLRAEQSEKWVRDSVKRVMNLEKYWESESRDEGVIAQDFLSEVQESTNVRSADSSSLKTEDNESKGYQLEILRPCPRSCSLSYSRKQTDVTLEVGQDGRHHLRSACRERRSRTKNQSRKLHHIEEDLDDFMYGAVDDDVEEMWERVYADTNETREQPSRSLLGIQFSGVDQILEILNSKETSESSWDLLETQTSEIDQICEAWDTVEASELNRDFMDSQVSKTGQIWEEGDIEISSKVSKDSTDSQISRLGQISREYEVVETDRGLDQISQRIAEPTAQHDDSLRATDHTNIQSSIKTVFISDRRSKRGTSSTTWSKDRGQKKRQKSRNKTNKNKTQEQSEEEKPLPLPTEPLTRRFEELCHFEVLVPTQETGASLLEGTFGENYLEASTAPRRFVINMKEYLGNIFSSEDKIRNELISGYVMFSFARSHSADKEKYWVVLNLLIGETFVPLQEQFCLRVQSVLGVVQYFVKLVNALFVSGRPNGWMTMPQESMPLIHISSSLDLIKRVETEFFFPWSQIHRLSSQNAIQDFIYLHTDSTRSVDLTNDLKETGWETPDVCGICLQLIGLSDDVTGTGLRECGHVFCEECWASYMYFKVKDNSWRLTCPHHDCDVLIGLLTLMTFLTSVCGRPDCSSSV